MNQKQAGNYFLDAGSVLSNVIASIGLSVPVAAVVGVLGCCCNIWYMC
jgi:hypothetical protein